MPTGPFDGVRILDVSTMLAGPWASGILADQGADVIKIEESGRPDGMRSVGTRKGDVSAPFFMANRGKRCVALDLRSPEGKAALLRLVETADVFLQNARPGVMEKLGLGYEDLRAVKDDIIYCSVSGFGDTGPWARKGALDPIMQSFSGLAWMQGGRDGGTPVCLRTNITDKVTALNAAQAISAALYARKDGRGGQNIHVSMLSATAAFNWVEATRDEAFLDADVVVKPSPVENVRLYKFADGWASVVPMADAALLDMLRVFGVDNADDPRLQTFASRMQHPEVTEAAMAAWQEKIAYVPLAEGMERLAAIDVHCAPVLNLGDFAAHPHVVAADVFSETDIPGLGLVRQANPAARFSGTPARVAGPAPAFGEHSASVLAEVGIDAAALAAKR